MRLLFVIDNLQSGGAQRQMVSLSLGLRSRGHEVEFFLYYPQYRHFMGVVDEAGIPIHAYNKVRRYSFNVIMALRRQIVAGRYDLILSFLRTPNIYAEIASVGRNMPVLVVSERGPLPASTPSAIQYLMRYLHKLADHITVNSYHQQENIELHHPRLRGRISTIYNGIDLTIFHPTEKRDRLTARKRLEIIAIGTIHPHKNPSILINSLALYRQKYHDLPILVRWVGKQSYSETRDLAFREASSLITELSLENHWEWAGERRDVPSLLRQSDLLIHPSTRDGLSNAICEALACGIPVLAGRIADNSRLIEHGVRGYLFDPRQPSSIVDALRRFIELEPSSRERMGERARVFAEENLSLSKLTDSYERLFVELTSGGPR